MLARKCTPIVMSLLPNMHPREGIQLQMFEAAEAMNGIKAILHTTNKNVGQIIL